MGLLMIVLSNFCPISLLSSTYKIISKCLASRLKMVLPLVVSQTQGAFLIDRSMLDDTLCANECIDSRLCSGLPGMLCKVDMEKNMIM